MAMDSDDKFQEIRPYTDEEYPAVLSRLISNRYLLDTIRKIKWPGCPGFLRPPANWLIKQFIRFQLRGIKNRQDFQKKLIIDKFMKWIIQDTTRGLSYSGQDKLHKDATYLYISNHRDIVMDVALLSCVISEIGFSTLEIAIGNNLLVNQFVEDLIRINRSFIVKRNLPPREQLRASVELSEYINYTMDRGNSIWIAQREGRAKDGEDLTNPAVIKMIYLSQRKSGVAFSDYINKIKIVPVAISYEYDPLDNLKAWEIYHKKSRGAHKKRKDEDLISMLYGIKGMKGRVHLAFGEPLKGDFPNDKAVADAIDQFIVQNYKIWPTNYIAYDELNGGGEFSGYYTPEEKEKFLKRFRYLPPAVKEIVLETYGKAVAKKIDPEGPF